MVEDVTPRPDQPPTPITRLQTIAVRSDGSISRVYKWDVRLPMSWIFPEVIDATTRTHVVVEDFTRTVVNDKYFDMQALKPGVLCEGKPGGQIQGFDVVYSEHPMGTADISTDGPIHWKRPNWVAIRLFRSGLAESTASPRTLSRPLPASSLVKQTRSI